MKGIKASDLREKTVQELEDLLEKERAALFETRRKLVFREIKDVNSVRRQRHNIARINTLITERRRGERGG